MFPVIALWAHPRSLSTALERAFIERGDFEVLHEPFSVVYYFHEKRRVAQGADFTDRQAADYDSVRQSILRAAEQGPVFFKDMCYHCHDHLRDDDAFLRLLTNVFLIRDPQQAIASHYAQNPQVTSEEIGYEKQASIFRQVAQRTGAPPVVVTAEDLQQNPRGIWRALCTRLGLDDRPDALQWQPGQREEWGIWKPWHQTAAQSDGIKTGQTEYVETVANNPQLAAFDRFHRPFYDELYEHRIRPAE